ncbi:hypothetical protein OsJ_23795 [Oryza sativa Japonica Group]|uniref:Uncharacterized protein n=1 Tax=Oryza sativa subsp. japonica TaxID=39947 RepID=B9FWJ8_ORYSJ|nr:hypothetical protein OsJ_23795 [Oryza sativa Japonica Group]
MHMKATASDDNMARVSETKNAWNANFLDIIGSPSLPELELYPPGNVKAAAKRLTIVDLLLGSACNISIETSLCM